MSEEIAAMARRRESPNGDGSLDPSLLVLDDLRTWFETPEGLVHAVDGISLSVRRGETLGIVGESGSGKSVLCRSIMGLLPESGTTRHGHVWFDGRDLVPLSAAQLRTVWGLEIAMVFQDASTSLNPVKRVEDQAAEAMRQHWGYSRQRARARVIELFHEVGIPDASRRLRDFPHQFSGGMKQRISIATALTCEPSLILADEPTTALDVTIEAQILDLLQDEQQRRNMAMILVTHNLGIVAGRADRVAVMYAGRLMEVASTRHLFSRPRSPYTAALLASLPKLTDAPHTRLSAIGGRPPSLIDPPAGCRFAARCPRVEARCHHEDPTMTPDETEPTQEYACFNPVPVASLDTVLGKSDVGG